MRTLRSLARSRPVLVFTVVAVATALVSACGEDDPGESSDAAAISVVATTTQLADIVSNVGGERVDVHSILGSGVDPHDYEPRPSDAAAFSEAAVVFKSGGDLDAWLDDLVENAGSEGQVVEMLGFVDTIEGGEHHHGDEEHADEEEHAGEEVHAGEEEHAEEEDEEHADEADPHWWQSPGNAVLAAQAIRDALIEADPNGRETYEKNASAYVRRLGRLDKQVERCVEQVRAAKRKIVTTHDALGYYADRYGIEVVGSIIASLSTQAQPSSKDISLLVDQIEEEGVEAVFPEAGVSSRIEKAIARETGAMVGGELWVDTLGEEGTPEASYVGAMAGNTAALVEGMSGGAVQCRPEVP